MRWWRTLADRHRAVEARIEESTQAMRAVSDVVLQLRASTDRLETVLSELADDVAALKNGIDDE